MVSVGQAVANFSLPATGDQILSLDDFKGRHLVIWFYPKDNTPGCTREGQGFRDAHAEFQAAGAEVLGVSRDSVKSHENFKAKQSFPFELLADTEEELRRVLPVVRALASEGALISIDTRRAASWRRRSRQGPK